MLKESGKLIFLIKFVNLSIRKKLNSLKKLLPIKSSFTIEWKRGKYSGK